VSVHIGFVKQNAPRRAPALQRRLLFAPGDKDYASRGSVDDSMTEY